MAKMQYTFIGTTDEINQCGCCGRTDLKGTKVLKDNESGEFVFYGSVCGARALGWTVKEFDKAANDAEKARVKARRDYENSHPLRASWNNLLNQLNEVQRERMVAGNRMSFQERMAHPLFLEARKVEAEMKADIEEKYPSKIK